MVCADLDLAVFWRSQCSLSKQKEIEKNRHEKKVHGSTVRNVSRKNLDLMTDDSSHDPLCASALRCAVQYSTVPGTVTVTVPLPVPYRQSVGYINNVTSTSLVFESTVCPTLQYVVPV